MTADTVAERQRAPALEDQVRARDSLEHLAHQAFVERLLGAQLYVAWYETVGCHASKILPSFPATRPRSGVR